MDWHLLEQPLHRGVQNLVRDLNRVYGAESALWEVDSEPAGFEWLDVDNALENIIAFLRRSPETGREIICVCNFSAVPRKSYRLALLREGQYEVLINTVGEKYGGNESFSMAGEELDLPPLSTVWLAPQKAQRVERKSEKAMIEWANIREQFPVTSNSVYLNTAAAGPVARATAQAAALYYEQMMNDGDVHWDEWMARREEVRAQVATFINAEPDEIGFTINTSSGMNLIVDALENHGEVVSCDLEFPVTIIPWMHRRIPVHIVKSVAGVVTPEALRAAMNTRTGIISLSYVQYSNGFRSSLEELAGLKGGHALVINASQAAGVFEIDVKRVKIDALCVTGHKWMLAGYGSGFVYLSRELQAASRPRAIGWLSVKDAYQNRNNEVHLRPDLSARSELGCPHFAGIFALGASIELLQSIGPANIEARALELNRTLTKRLNEIGWKVLSPLGEEQQRSAETLVAAENPAQVVHALAEKKIIVTEKPQGIRVSTHFFNDEADIERLIEGLDSLSNLRDSVV